MTYSPEVRARRTQRERDRRARLRPEKLAARDAMRAPCAECGGVIPTEKQSNARYCSEACLRTAAKRRETDAEREERRARQLARSRAWRAENSERDRENARAWRAANRDKANGYSQKWRSANQDQDNARSREYRAANPEKIHALNHRPGASEQRRIATARWRRENPDLYRARQADAEHRRRARMRSAPVIEAVDRAAIIARDKSRCHLCGKRVPKAQIHLDHIVPLALGGEHTARNLAVAHADCNRRKWINAANEQLRLVG